MVEHAVEDDADAALVRLINHLQGQLIGLGPHPGFRVARVFGGHQGAVAFRIGAEIRVDVVVAGAIVFVVGRRIEDRIQVDGVDAEILQVIELVDDALDITAITPALHVLPQLRFAIGFFVILQLIPIAAPRVHAPLLRWRHRIGAGDVGDGRVVRRVAIAVPVREDLIPDR